MNWGSPNGNDVNCDSENLSFYPITVGILGSEKQRKDASTGIGYSPGNFPLITWSLYRFRNKKILRSLRVADNIMPFLQRQVKMENHKVTLNILKF
jgi:hypothetical protein